MHAKCTFMVTLTDTLLWVHLLVSVPLKNILFTSGQFLRALQLFRRLITCNFLIGSFLIVRIIYFKRYLLNKIVWLIPFHFHLFSQSTSDWYWPVMHAVSISIADQYCYFFFACVYIDILVKFSSSTVKI